jgi:hypothetical protein
MKIVEWKASIKIFMGILLDFQVIELAKKSSGDNGQWETGQESIVFL